MKSQTMKSSTFFFFFFSFIFVLHSFVSISSAYPQRDGNNNNNHKDNGVHNKHEETINFGRLKANTPSPSTVAEVQIPTVSEILSFDAILSSSYYRKSCPDAQAIISRKVKEWVDKDYSVPASLLRLHFHDCAVRGCDASVLLNHEGSERTAEASKTLRGFEVIDEIKAEIEKKCPKTVSCADILTAATRDATVLVGGPYWTVEFGRRDGRVSIAKEADMVPTKGHENVTALVEFFQSLGLGLLDLVVLSGSHTIGKASCGSIQHRLYNYSASGKPDPSIDAKYLNFLQRKCRWGSEYIDLDATTPNIFDSAYYKNLQQKMGLLYTDQILYSDPRTSPIVTTLLDTPSIFHQQFGASMAKLGNVGVLTAEDREGEVRQYCSRVNSY